MKTMTCKQLGGACEEKFHADTFEEIAELSKNHALEMIEKKDDAHTRYSDESTPPFRIKGRHLFRSKSRQSNRPLSSLSKDDIFQS